MSTDFETVPLAEALLRGAAVHPDRDCIVFVDDRATYGELAERARRVGRSLIGLGVALYGSRLLESFLFGVERGDPVLLAGVSVAVFSVALLASLIPAQRAARVDPMITLRGD